MSQSTAAPVKERFSTTMRNLVRESMESGASADPAVIADSVLARLSTEQYHEALTVVLGDWVRTEMANVSRSARNTARAGKLTTPDRVRGWYAQQLGMSMFVGTTWKFLRDCSAEDLHNAAAERYRKAAETSAEADRWTKVALFMEEHDRDHVAEITESELKSLMEAS